jgi:hypothetical protein
MKAALRLWEIDRAMVLKRKRLLGQVKMLSSEMSDPFPRAA